MSYKLKLTEIKNPKVANNNPLQRIKSLKENSLNYELDDNFYENLFLYESEFKMNPKKEKMQKILGKYCKAVEYFSANDDNKREKEYKMLIDLFLNSPNVLNLLDNKNNSNYDSVKKIITDNKKNKMNNILEEDNITIHSSKIKKILKKEEEKEKINKLINDDENEIKKKDSTNLINEDIKNQQNKFQQKLMIKKHSLFKKVKSINENKLLMSIQNASINENKEIEKINIGGKNSTNINNQISPIKNETNSDNKENISNNIINSFSYSNNKNDKDNSTILNTIINKKKTSEFEPMTPLNSYKLDESNNKSSSTNKKMYNSVEINETNEFSLNNDNDSPSDNIKTQNNKILKDTIICSDETKESYNISNNNSSKISEGLNNSSNKSNLYKNFRLDFNDLFEYMKDSNITNKQKLFCKDIKLTIENYIKEYNQYLNENLFIKYAKQYSNLWDEMYKKYVDISDIYDKEIKKIDEKISIYMNDENKLKELQNLSENLKIERENEINKSEERFTSKIESISLDFKNNYNNNDEGILLLNEKFALLISKQIFDMINNSA